MKGATPAGWIDEAEVSQLLADYGPGRRRRVRLEVSAMSFEGWLGKMSRHPNRRGEVALAIQRPDGRILLHRKRFYPDGVFRIPTGGVLPNEAVLAGVMREAYEETGLSIVVKRFLGTVEYQFRCGLGRLSFVSYVFVVQADERPPVVQDSEEAIVGFRYVPPSELRSVAAQLRALPEPWSDWGRFRAPPHEVVAEALGV